MIGPITFFLTTMAALFAGLFFGFIIGYAEGAKNSLPDIIITPPNTLTPPNEENHHDIDEPPN